jgi:hypothetical protein
MDKVGFKFFLERENKIAKYMMAVNCVTLQEQSKTSGESSRFQHLSRKNSRRKYYLQVEE